MTAKQCTLKDSFTLRGVGLHTGVSVTMKVMPAAVNHGVKFQRIDLPDRPVVPADINMVQTTQRGTTIGRGDASIATVEHILSALAGFQVDNALIEIDGPEVPILDGSARTFYAECEKAGKVAQDAERAYFEIQEPILYTDEQSGAEYMALPADQLEITCLIDFNSPYLGQQYATLTDIEDYGKQIASCRTFVFLHEIEGLIDQGLIKGGDLDNAIVIADRIMTDSELERVARKLGKSVVHVEKEGVLNTTELQFKNEPARHKLLDVLGDLSLLGTPIKGKIVARKPGHGPNVAFTRVLKKKLVEQRKLRGKPNYDPDETPVYDINQIHNFLPHRHPFLLVDKIIELSPQHVVGIKNITYDQWFFPGHFPNNPIFPGVLQIEALAQTGGILALSTVPDPENWDTLFIKIDNTRFKSKVMPGDTLILKMELLNPIRRGICHMYGTAYVGNKIVSEGELTAQIIKRDA
ncbi:MAG: bifunctional UDP-3-O-[3-hydroxymyristoyl] N-acetylglucosamine deacetylase/3-hydroxyacyl-ACP dehydratase [Saprospiraceae bacterium]|nr:bifunctional UDP-3-O-[3-hydroxymyristoyl] N-acetylglucosamine deacetylase/3-hydroxyacyl-ACP dehydratase [Saprospiraceae bacterium]MCB9318399.1 bifunctional UDP-3-O-[3-hydroxymyristoyl] N-acetylglucosamine deacetylase/3-hydroxyacyl-ACP dehydratase [Lewinellaceae bacterium]